MTVLSAKRMSALATVDAMSPALRECVHDFGLPIVTVLTKFGLRDPRHIREVVREIWAGPRTGGGAGQTSGAMSAFDFVLARGPVSSRTLLRMLADNNMTIVSAEPTRAMIDASLTAVTGHKVICSKEEKHRRRLRAALRAAMEEAISAQCQRPREKPVQHDIFGDAA